MEELTTKPPTEDPATKFMGNLGTKFMAGLTTKLMEGPAVKLMEGRVTKFMGDRVTKDTRGAEVMVGVRAAQDTATNEKFFFVPSGEVVQCVWVRI